ncbi:MAG: hypothetical protein PHG02_05575 [Oscillospiraceae bacterium]|nr:hypothetical protein [Oscillospiraceae bacterium]
MALFYDLHIHSALSPCAENDMTPATIAGLCKLNGADVIALADHNSALNLPAAKAACEAYGLQLLPAIEVNTAEEIHVLCYFKTVEQALKMGEILYDHLPIYGYDEAIWGRQLVMDADDKETQCVEKLLTGAVDLDIYDIVKLCQSFGGIAVPAHADKDSYSLLSVLGFQPPDLHFDVIELAHPEKYEAYCKAGLLQPGMEVIHSSDAHSLSMLQENFMLLCSTNPLHQLLGVQTK